MYINVERILEKIESELGQTRLSNSKAEMHARIHSIKSLCELILEGESKQARITNKKPPERSVKDFQKQMLPSQKAGNKTDMTDGANGDSIFDF